MIEFFQTVMGKVFFDVTLPRLIQALERIAQALEQSGVDQKRCQHSFTKITESPDGDDWEWCIRCGALRDSGIDGELGDGSLIFFHGSHQEATIVAESERK